MRWLLVKDLQILRRSPLLVVLLVAYPVIISVLIGLALSKGPDKPTIAFVNEVPGGQTRVHDRRRGAATPPRYATSCSSR